jgi:hypothetical protein
LKEKAVSCELASAESEHSRVPLLGGMPEVDDEVENMEVLLLFT